MELTERDNSAFEDILSFLSRHPDLKKLELRDEPIISLPGFEIDLTSRKVYCNQQEIELTTKEYDILHLLVTNKGRVLTFSQIYENAWKDSSLGNERKAVGYHIWNLRKKLYGAISDSYFTIENVREVGYRFEIHTDST